MQSGVYIAESEGPVVGALVDSDRRKVDAKRRLTVRSSWRATMGDPSGVYLVPGEFKGADGDKGDAVRCIEIIPPAVFNAKRVGVCGLAEDDPYRIEVEHYLRYVSHVEFDSDGRITIPAKYLKFAEITDKVVLNGSGDRIRVWAAGSVEVDEEIDFDDFKKRRRAVNKGSAVDVF